MLPIAIPGRWSRSWVSNLLLDDPRASESYTWSTYTSITQWINQHSHYTHTQTQVKEWLYKNGLDRFVVTYGEKSLTKFDIYVEIDWILSAFRKRLAGKRVSKRSKTRKRARRLEISTSNVSVLWEKTGAALIPCGTCFAGIVVLMSIWSSVDATHHYLCARLFLP